MLRVTNAHGVDVTAMVIQRAEVERLAHTIANAAYTDAARSLCDSWLVGDMEPDEVLRNLTQVSVATRELYFHVRQQEWERRGYRKCRCERGIVKPGYNDCYVCYQEREALA